MGRFDKKRLNSKTSTTKNPTAFNGKRAYAKGYRFETTVRKTMERFGYKVFRQKGSAFPDLIALPELRKSSEAMPEKMREFLASKGALYEPIIIECKIAKYIKPAEREGLELHKKWASVFVVYPTKAAVDGRTVILNFCSPEDYTLFFRTEA